ncbi:hypothetical protein MKR65_11495 [Acinetobacter baumannii]
MGVNGLRPPQLGGIFAALGYERSDEKMQRQLSCQQAQVKLKLFYQL